MSLHLTIVTQEKELLSTQVDSITAMTTTGEVTILPGHIPLMSKLSDTEFVYRINGQEASLAITGGFLNVEPGDRIVVLADAAVRSEEINEEKAREARKRAQEAMQNEKLSKTELSIAEQSLRKALLELKVAAKRKPHI